MIECKQCSREYESKRSTSQYCSAKCRKLAFQGVGSEVSVPDSTKPNLLAVPGDPHILKRADLAHWRGSRPYYLDQDTHLAHLSDEQLHRRLSGLTQWQGTPEYAERVYRLAKGLTDYCMPANMTEAAYV